MKSVFKILATLGMASSLLTGCAVYSPPVAYSQDAYYQPYYEQAAPVYVQPGYRYYGAPAPVYVQPGPVYIEPPVTFGFNFGYWSGGRRGWGGRSGWRGHHHW